MGMALQRRSHDGLVDGDRREALERYRKDFMRVRLELAELKRTGSQQGRAELISDASTLSMRIKRFETLLRA
jgi:hypothetical protein